MRKVLFVSHNHSSTQPGGVEIYLDEVLEAMSDHDAYEPFLVARIPQPPGASGPRFTGSDDRHVFHMLSREAEFDPVHCRAYDSRLHTEDWHRFLAELKPDVVHFHHSMWWGYEGLSETRRALPEAPIVYTLHEFVPICHHRGQMLRTGSLELSDHASPERCHACFPEISADTFARRETFIKGMLEHVDLFLAPSHFLRQRYIEWGIPPERIRYEENGRIIAPAQADSADAGRRRRIGFFGQLHGYKGIEILLEAMRILETEGVGAQLLMRGANLEYQGQDFRDRMHRLLDQAGGSVDFGGAYGRDELPGLLSEVDWAVVPSRFWENSPLVIQEAMMARRPVICADVGGMAEKVRDGVDGLHFAHGDPHSLAQTVRRAVSEPELWDQLQAGIEPPRGMSQHLSALTEIYDHLVSQRSALAPAGPQGSGRRAPPCSPAASP